MPHLDDLPFAFVGKGEQSSLKILLALNRRVDNLACIKQRIFDKAGCIPLHITIMSWYGFLLNQWCRPYQRAVLGGPGIIRGVDFQSVRPIKISQRRARQYYCNHPGDLYQNWVADFAVKVNEATEGAAVRRLSELYDEIYVDEVQDLVGYDLEVLDFLARSPMHLVMVGDVRQHTYATNQNPKNRRYRGARIVEWLEERPELCRVENWTVSYRCRDTAKSLREAMACGVVASG